MIRHILLPTDGSARSRRAIEHGIQLASVLNARVTGLHVIPLYHRSTCQAQMLMSYRTPLPEVSAAAYNAASADAASKLLRFVARTAARVGVHCDVVSIRGDQPYEAIIAAAEEHRCDLIVMASHGHGRLAGLLLGNETHKVLVHSHVPVLVYR